MPFQISVLNAVHPARIVLRGCRVEKVELKNICVSYGEHAVLKDFSLTIEPGQIMGIVGPSGCGKTTIARAICGFIKPQQGTVKIDGKTMFSHEDRVDIPPEQRYIGVVFQDYAVWPHLSVYDNIAYPLKKRRLSKEEISPQVQNALEQVNMVGYEKYMPSQLSGGQQQRVAIARALTSSSDFLIMDEPITNLDAKLREQMLVEIRMLQQRLGTTIIYITHDQEAALQLCDKIVILEPDGSIAQIGSDEEIIRNPANRFVFQFIGVSNFIPVVVEDGKVFFDLEKKILFKSLIHEKMPGPKAMLGIRPMDIVFDDDSPVRATVAQSVFLGNMYNYFVRLPGMEIRVQQMVISENAKSYSEEQEVGLAFLEERYFEREDA
jgi:iron(III) transport system ATP-binding protein